MENTSFMLLKLTILYLVLDQHPLVMWRCAKNTLIYVDE